MLVEFRATNFRSIKEEQVFSMVASSDDALRDTHTYAALPSIRTLNSAVLYGANASGKSNLLKAIQCMQEMVAKSAAGIPELNVFHRSMRQFLLADGYADQPTQFEITFVLNHVRYQYAFSLTPQRIESENLWVYESAKPQHWFSRQFNLTTQKYDYTFSTKLKGAKHVWKEATRHNCLFLSMAVQLNSDTLEPLFKWLTEDLVIANEYTELKADLSIEQLVHSVNGKARIARFLAAADTGISDVTLKPIQVAEHQITLDAKEGKATLSTKQNERYAAHLHHQTQEGSEVLFDLNDESTGTRKLFLLAGALHVIIDTGRTILFDELDVNLHPHLVEAIIQLFHNSETNPHGAQLVFTTHNPSLLDSGLFRRDQVWLVEKNRDQASTLTPLLNFSVRKGEKMGKHYLEGRYGGVPIIDHNMGLI
jgi:AAA15 family ATPase/GTPase